MLSSTLAILLLNAASIAALSIQDVPQCAQNCLSTSTKAQTACGVVDIACLCTNNAYVTTLSCCLATACTATEQGVAIEFNQQECANVNETAPSFVGCSPFSLSSNVVLGGSATPVPTGSRSQTTLMTTTSSIVSVITAAVISEPATLNGSGPMTADFAGKPLLTGSCTEPYFAAVTDAVGSVTEFPAIGCAPGRDACCPYEFGLNALVTKCPQDYFTTLGGCCPMGYQVYYTTIGPETPCYSVPPKILVPATTPTISGLTLITNHIFAQKYPLASSSGGLPKLPLGGLIGIVVNAVLFIAVIIALIWYRRRKARRLAEANRPTTFPPVEPTFSTSEARSPHELPSPDESVTLSRSPAAAWPIIPASSPPAYDHKARPISTKTDVVQELPGSTFIHEHHPAISGDMRRSGPSSHSPPQTPATPTRSPLGSEAGSPMVTPLSSVRGTRSPPVISPLHSPKLPNNGRLEVLDRV